MKLTKRQIDNIIEHTPAELKGFQKSFESDFGWYMKRDANWSYQAGWVQHNSGFVLAVKVFGIIK